MVRILSQSPGCNRASLRLHPDADGQVAVRVDYNYAGDE
jgi:hypothetical protein